MHARVSTQNSSAAALLAGATFTGVAEDVAQYSSVTVFCATDVASAVNGFSIEFSTDGVEWDRVKQVDFMAGDGSQVHGIGIMSKWLRVVYVNGAAPQTHFRLQTIGHLHKPRDLSTGTEQVITKADDVTLVRAAEEPRTDINLGLVDYRKFIRVVGTNPVVANGAFEVVSDDGTAYFPTAASTVRVRAGGDAADAAAGAGARSVTVEGLDAAWAPQVATITLNANGTLASAATTELFLRVNSFVVTATGTYATPSAGGNIGTIILEDTATSTAMSTIRPGLGLSRNGFYSSRAGVTLYLRRFAISCSDNNTCDLRGFVRAGADTVAAPFTPKLRIAEFIDFHGSFEQQPIAYASVPECSDFWLEAERDTGNGTAGVTVFVDFLEQTN